VGWRWLESRKSDSYRGRKRKGGRPLLTIPVARPRFDEREVRGKASQYPSRAVSPHTLCAWPECQVGRRIVVPGEIEGVNDRGAVRPGGEVRRGRKKGWAGRRPERAGGSGGFRGRLAGLGRQVWEARRIRSGVRGRIKGSLRPRRGIGGRHASQSLALPRKNVLLPPASRWGVPQLRECGQYLSRAEAVAILQLSSLAPSPGQNEALEAVVIQQSIPPPRNHSG